MALIAAKFMLSRRAIGYVRRKIGNVKRRLGEVARRKGDRLPANWKPNPTTIIPNEPAATAQLLLPAPGQTSQGMVILPGGQGTARPATASAPNQTTARQATSSRAQRASAAQSAEQTSYPHSRINPETGGPGDFFSALRADRTALGRTRQNYRRYRRANQGKLEASFSAAADFFTATDLPEHARAAAMWRRGIAAGTAGLVGIGIGTRALDAAFNRPRY